MFATAASMNGYTSSTASLTLDSGLKVSLPSHTPAGFFVDLKVSAAAPPYLAASGFADCLARSVAQTDWWMSHRLLGTAYFQEPYTIQAADEIELKDLCAPRCTVDGSCPRDVPSGTTASPDCAIEEDNQRLCALVCVPAAAAAGCPDGASCKAIQGVGLTPEAGLRGPGLGLLEPPLPSAAQFDDAWDHRVCATK